LLGQQNKKSSLAQGHVEGGLALPNLTTLSAKAAQGLLQRKGRLVLGLKTLPDETAKALAPHTGAVSIDGLTTLSDESAKALAQYAGALSLHGLTTLSDEAAKALRSNPRISLPAKFNR
jgi:hypothetical protein